MRKKLVYVICLVCTMLCCGCQKENIQNKETSHNNKINIKNETENHDVKEENNTITLTGKEDIVEINSSLDRVIPEDIQSITEHATHIVKGEIQKVDYIMLDGAAWTKTDVIVNEVLYGEIENHSMISIYQLGGYCPVADYVKENGNKGFENYSKKQLKNTMLKFVVEEEEIPKVGEESLYYLIQREPEYSGLPEGAFERVAGKYSQLQTLEGDLYSREQCEDEEQLEKSLGHEAKKKINKKEGTEQFEQKELKRVIDNIKNRRIRDY